MSRALQRMLGFSVIFGVLACSLIVETDEIDSGCEPTTKFCAGRCVKVSDPTYGCKSEGCDPCQRDGEGDPFGDRYVPKCVGDKCEIDRCAFGWGCEHCDVMLFNDDRNCGQCMNDCTLSGKRCAAGTCVPEDGVGGAGGSPG